MKLRRLTRAAFGLLAYVGFPLLVLLSFNPRGTRTEEVRGAVAQTLLAEAEGIRDRLRFAEFDFREVDGDDEVYRLHAAEAIAWNESGEELFRLKDVKFESRDKGSGRVLYLSAPRAELNQGSKAFRVFDGVRIEGEGMSLLSETFRYEPVGRVFRSDGPVRAAGEGLSGGAEKGQLASRTGIVTLERSVRLRGREEGDRSVDLRADHAELSRQGGLTARGDVVFKSGELVLRGARLSRQPEGDGDRIEAGGGVVLVVSPRPKAPAEGTAAPAPGPVLASGDSVDLQRSATGEPLFANLSNVEGRSVVFVPPGPSNGARRALSRRYEARFASGLLREVNLPEPFVLVEASGPSGLRSVVAEKGQVTFDPDGQTVSVANLEGGVEVVDGSRARARAPRASYRGTDRSVVFAGDARTPADYRDERARITAATLTLFTGEDRLEAAGSVRATYQAQAGSQPLLGSGPASDSPVFSESDFLRALTREKKLLLMGNVRAWQDENVLRARTVALDETERTLRAEGDVKAFLRRRPEEGKGKGETLTASGAVLTHREKERLVRIEGDATVVSGPWTIKSIVTDVRMGQDRTLELAEARGNVVVEDRVEGRRGEGSRALWRANIDVISLEGKPATALDGKGNKMTGAVLTFHRGRSRVDVETLPGIPSEGTLKPEGS